MIKKTISAMIALAMIIMLTPASAFAAPAGTAVTNAAGLRRVLTNAVGGAYYLASDIVGFSGSSIKVAVGTYTLDLNGHNISGHVDGGSGPVILVSGGSLTIKDSVGSGSITHTVGSDGTYADAAGCDSGILTITGGTCKGAYGTWSEGGTTNISGGSFIGDYYGAIVHGGTMNISGGTFSVNTNEEDTAAVACIPYSGKGTLTVSGGSFRAEGGENAKALLVSGGSCAVKGGTFTSDGAEAVSHTGGELTVTGGSFSGAADSRTEGGTGMRTYKAGQFLDIDESKWYGLGGAKTVAGVWENRLMDGVAPGRFGVGTYLTIAQALVVADKINCEYETGDPMPSGSASGSQWYQYFVDYAIERGIIKAGEFSNYDAYATRAEMVHIFANCLPDSEFEPLTVVEALPDVKESDKYGDEIFMFYRAGILSGSDAQGTFHPDSRILREEAAAIFLHVYDKETRSPRNINAED